MTAAQIDTRVRQWLEKHNIQNPKYSLLSCEPDGNTYQYRIKLQLFDRNGEAERITRMEFNLPFEATEEKKPSGIMAFFGFGGAE